MKILLLLMIAMAVCVVEGKKKKCKANGTRYRLTRGYKEGCIEYTCRCRRRNKRNKCKGVYWDQKRICSPTTTRRPTTRRPTTRRPTTRRPTTRRPTTRRPTTRRSTPASTTTAPEDSCFEFDMNYIGLGLNKEGGNNNYGSTGSAKECQLLCQTTAGCEWFNWYKPKGNCWLKSGKGDKGTPNSEGITGPTFCKTSGKPWIVSWNGGEGSYYDHPAYSSEEAHRVCESTGGVVAEMDSQNELDAVSQYADDNLQNSNAICEKPTESETEDCFERDTDYYGNDINLSTARTSDRRNSASECQALCREREGCLYFTWKRTPKECFLKNGGGPGKGNVDAEATSGPRTCGSRVLFPRVARKRRSSRNKRSRRKRAEKFTTTKNVSIYVVMKF